MPESSCLIETPGAMERRWSNVHVHAPLGDESFIAVPPLTDAVDIAHRNRERLAAARADVQGRELGAIRQWARREVLAAAEEYTGRLLAGVASERTGGSIRGPMAVERPGLDRPSFDSAETTLFVGGHQPTLFHPGVWVKNFVVGRLAQQDRAVGLNLVVDTDTLSGTAIRVPTGRPDAPGVATVAFDNPRPQQPWEEARVEDRPLFASFAERVAATLGDFGFRPLVADFWAAAVRKSEECDSLAECLTAARSAWERSWGVANLELPVSRLCTLEPFLWFSAHILAHLPRFHAIYNEALREYRHVNHVRSRTHPVPDLRATDGWLEAPFRVWRAGDRLRRRVFARQEAGEIRLSDGDEVFAKLPLAPDKDACCAVKELQKLAPQGIRFRTRALTTTMFARLCFADLFVHGIGGAKYDQMTDRIVARFFGLAAPEFLTMSATVHLVEANLAVDRVDECRLKHQLRELDYNSDRHLPAEPTLEDRALVAEKARLIADQHAVALGSDPLSLKGAQAIGGERANGGRRESGRGYERFRRFQEINRQLAERTQADRRRIEDELSRTRQQLAATSILHDREYAFCLYPAEKLKRFMDHVSPSPRG